MQKQIFQDNSLIFKSKTWPSDTKSVMDFYREYLHLSKNGSSLEIKSPPPIQQTQHPFHCWPPRIPWNLVWWENKRYDKAGWPPGSKVQFPSFFIWITTLMNLYSVCICPCVHECVCAHVCCVQACRAQFSILGISQCLLPLLHLNFWNRASHRTQRSSTC